MLCFKVLLLCGVAHSASEHHESKRILIASDFHEAPNEIRQLVEEVKCETFDIVLCPGDFTKCSRETCDSNRAKDPTKEKERQSALSVANDSLAELMRISRELYYLPGNHDPMCMFTHTCNFFSGSDDGNVHNKVVTIAEDLILVGWGGSVAGTKNGQAAWRPYPWTEAEINENGWLENLNVRTTQALNRSTQILLLLHQGPKTSSTTMVFGRDADSITKVGLVNESDVIFSGSASLEKHFVSPQIMQEKVVMLVHGHTHYGTGMAPVGVINVLNPGPLKLHFHYAVVTLAKRGGIWRAGNIEFRVLGSQARCS